MAKHFLYSKYVLPLGLLVGGIILGLSIGWFLFAPSVVDLYRPPVKIAYFDETSINTIMGLRGTEEARFYYAQQANGGPGAIMAPVDSIGRHVPEDGATQFRRYKTLDRSRTDLELLDENRARTVVRQSRYKGSSPWSVDCSRRELERLINMTNCNGIGLSILRTADGDWTFGLIPVNISSGRAITIGTLEDIVVGEPCPNFCPDPEQFYLNL